MFGHQTMPSWGGMTPTGRALPRIADLIASSLKLALVDDSPRPRADFGKQFTPRVAPPANRGHAHRFARAANPEVALQVTAHAECRSRASNWHLVPRRANPVRMDDAGILVLSVGWSESLAAFGKQCLAALRAGRGGERISVFALSDRHRRIVQWPTLDVPHVGNGDGA
jgi:hypothetical protein